MEKTIKTVIPMEGKIIRANIIEEGKAIEVVRVCESIEFTKEYLEEYFPIVKASTLSVKDNFLKYWPRTKRQRVFKKELVAAIKSGLTDFRAQKIDPSLDIDGSIYYQEGNKPAVGKSAQFWKEKAEEFMPEKKSRLGTRKERIVFLGVLMKYLIEEKGHTPIFIWEAICDKSNFLGHYWKSEKAKHDFEPTGSRKVAKWCDLGNTCKITFDTEFSVCGGNYFVYDYQYPLADVGWISDSSCNYYYATGWIVTEV